MTQFQPPPYPPPLGQQAYYPAAHTPTAPPPWSAAAIGGFILSLLGFAGVTAILGLIFGIVGIVTTSGGRRRGAGLAIAAIPISLVTGAASVVLVLGILLVTRAAEVPVKLQSVFGSNSSNMVDAVTTLRELGSPKFNEAVGTEVLQAWLTQINAEHGKLTSASLDTHQMVSERPDGTMCLNVNGKFVNGPAEIRLVFEGGDVWSLRIDDIEVGGSSPRGSADAPPPTKKEPSEP